MANLFNRNDGTFAAVTYDALNSAGGIFSSALASSVNLTSTTKYFDGPSVSVSASGATWLVTGQVTMITTNAGGDNFNCKLWDGTTVAASGETSETANFPTQMTLTGLFTSPAGGIMKISVQDSTVSNAGKIASNLTGAGKDCFIQAIRIG